jgi:hypothetical protein
MSSVDQFFAQLIDLAIGQRQHEVQTEIDRERVLTDEPFSRRCIPGSDRVGHRFVTFERASSELS